MSNFSCCCAQQLNFCLSEALLHVPVLGMSLRKVSCEAFVFSVFSRNEEKTKPQTWWSVSSKALQQLKSLLMCQAKTCGQVLALALVQVLQNSGSMKCTCVSEKNGQRAAERFSTHQESNQVTRLSANGLNH